MPEAAKFVQHGRAGTTVSLGPGGSTGLRLPAGNPAWWKIVVLQAPELAISISGKAGPENNGADAVLVFQCFEIGFA